MKSLRLLQNHRNIIYVYIYLIIVKYIIKFIRVKFVCTYSILLYCNIQNLFRTTKKKKF